MLGPGREVFGRYVVETLLGKGGMGSVWRGRQRGLEIPVAIKVILGEAGPDSLARFEREAKLMARAIHPSVVRVLDFGHLPEGPCIVMELVEGESLAERLQVTGFLDWAFALEIGSKVLAGLEVVHRCGIVHRDVKPENIMLRHGTDDPVLLDFGIARSDDGSDRVTRTGLAAGTPAYMAPEQFAGARFFDGKSDVYATGASLFECMTGTLPFEDPMDVASRFVDAPMLQAPPNARPVPETVRAFIASLMSVEPAQRPDAGAARRAIEQLLRPGEVRSEPRSNERRAVLVANLPGVNLEEPLVRGWLEGLSQEARHYVLGAQVWICIWSQSEQLSDARLEHLATKVRQRFSGSRANWDWLSVDTALTPAMFAGAQPLPDEVRSTLESVL